MCSGTNCSKLSICSLFITARLPLSPVPPACTSTLPELVLPDKAAHLLPLSPGRRLQPGDLAHGERPRDARLYVQLQRSIGHALDFLDVMPDGLEHAPDLPVPAFDQRDREPGIVA